MTDHDKKLLEACIDFHYDLGDRNPKFEEIEDQPSEGIYAREEVLRLLAFAKRQRAEGRVMGRAETTAVIKDTVKEHIRRSEGDRRWRADDRRKTVKMFLRIFEKRMARLEKEAGE